jgi:hypothetical protein
LPYVVNLFNFVLAHETELQIMTFEQWVRKYAVNSRKFLTASGFASDGSKHFYRNYKYSSLPYKMKQTARLMSYNFAKFAQTEDFDFEFLTLMKKSCVCITSERIYPRYCTTYKLDYWKRIQEDDEFCRRISLDLHTGVMLFVGEYEG